MASGSFRDEHELREVMDALFEMLATDPEIGPRLRDARTPQRFVFSDLDETLDVGGASDEQAAAGRFLVWAWGEDTGIEPEVTMRMSADTANGFWQGKVNPVIANATGRIRTRGDFKKALRLAPLVRPVHPRYRAMLAERGFHHLLL
jgi:hypothetical protein